MSAKAPHIAIDPTEFQQELSDAYMRGYLDCQRGKKASPGMTPRPEDGLRDSIIEECAKICDEHAGQAFGVDEYGAERAHKLDSKSIRALKLTEPQAGSDS